MNSLREKKKELRKQSDLYLVEMEENVDVLKDELNVYLKNTLIATGTGIAIWALGTGVSSLFGKKNSKKSRFGSAIAGFLSPIAAHILIELIKPKKEDNKIEKDELPAG